MVFVKEPYTVLKAESSDSAFFVGKIEICSRVCGGGITMIDDNYGSAEKFDFGRVLGRTFSTITGNFMPFFLLALLLEGVPTFLANAVSLMAVGDIMSESKLYNMFINDNLGAGMITLLVIGGLIGFVLYMLAYMTLQGTIIHASVEDFKSEDVNMRTSLSIGWRFALPLLGFTILSSLGVGLGLVLLIIPGVLLMCMWMVGASAVVIEGGGRLQCFWPQCRADTRL